MKRANRKREARDSGKTALIIGGTVLAVSALAGVFLFSGDAKADGTPPDEPPAPEPDPPAPEPDPPAPDPDPDPNPPADDGQNWGKTPKGLRAEFERAEKAAGIPGLGRFMAVWAWGAFRAKKDVVNPAEVAAICAANPEWCRKCHNDSDSERAASRKALDRVTLPIGQGGAYKKPWPKPADYTGWSDGSVGLFDVLLGAHAHDGIHNKGFAPLIQHPGSVAFRVDVQLYIAGYMVYRIVYREDLLVITKNDPRMTWANVRACTASPTGFQDLTAGKQTAAAAIAAGARENCLKRAAELGIDLSKLPQPMPWSWPGAGTYYQRLGVLAGADVGQLEGGGGGEEDASPAEEVGGFKVQRVTVGASASSPVVWCLHGRFGDLAQLQAYLPRLGSVQDAEYIFLSRGPSWIPTPDASPQSVTDQLVALAKELRVLRAELSPEAGVVGVNGATRPWIILGYSQGGAVALTLAAGGGMATVIGAAAALPKKPTFAGGKPRVVLLHGEDDKTVPPSASETTAVWFGDAGYSVAYDTRPEVGHSLATLGEPLVEVVEGELAKIDEDAWPADSKQIQLDGLSARVVNQAALGATAPLVLVLHGEKSSPPQLVPLLAQVKGISARFAFLRDPSGRWAHPDESHSWASEIDKAAARVFAAATTLKTLYPTSKLVVVGFSEGAAVGLRLAALGLVSAALAINGFLDPVLGPKGAVPVWAYFVVGGKDDKINPAMAQATVELFTNKVSRLTQQPVPNGTHELATVQAAGATALQEVLKEV